MTKSSALNTESLDSRELRVQEMESTLAAKTQQLNRLNARFGNGLWDWELGANTEWYSTRMACLLDYGLEGDFPNELIRLLAQATPESSEISELIMSQISQVQDFDQRLKIRNAEGESVWLRVRGAVTENSGEGLYTAGAIEDISDRVLLESERQRFSNELERSNEELEAFTNIASHDLKAPLRHISAYARMLQQIDNEHSNLSAKQTGYIAEIHSRINLMEDMLDSLLDYARVGRAKDRLETIDVEILCSEAVALLAPPEKFDIEIKCTAEPLEAELAVLQKCIRNLIDNALKHANRQSPVVHIDAYDLDNSVVIAISDNGPGIPEQQRTRAFELFQTLDQSTETKGSGMGLSIVRKSVQANGGSVEAGASELGGACVTIYWPRNYGLESAS